MRTSEGFKSVLESKMARKKKEPTGIEPVMTILQTAPLATWVRLHHKTETARRFEEKAGDEARTRNILLGKQALYH